MINSEVELSVSSLAFVLSEELFFSIGRGDGRDGDGADMETENPCNGARKLVSGFMVGPNLVITISLLALFEGLDFAAGAIRSSVPLKPFLLPGSLFNNSVFVIPIFWDDLSFCTCLASALVNWSWDDLSLI